MMNKKEFLHLKSGTDVRGTAVETAEHGVQLTDETVQKICVGFYKWYCRKEQVDTFGIAVGQDCRISSPRIAAAAMTAFCACGCRVAAFQMQEFFFIHHQSIPPTAYFRMLL